MSGLSGFPAFIPYLGHWILKNKIRFIMKIKSTFHTLFLVGDKGWEPVADFESAGEAHEHAADMAEETGELRYLVVETQVIEERKPAPVAARPATTKKVSKPKSDEK